MMRKNFKLYFIFHFHAVLKYGRLVPRQKIAFVCLFCFVFLFFGFFHLDVELFEIFIFIIELAFFCLKMYISPYKCESSTDLNEITFFINFVIFAKGIFFLVSLAKVFVNFIFSKNHLSF